MATAVRRATTPAPVLEGVNFMDPGMYSAGSFIPNGNYCVFHDVIIHQTEDKTGKKGIPRLGVMVSFYPFANPVEEAKLTQFYSLGTKAIDSFKPNPDTGKGIVAIPGTSGSLNNGTNWYIYFNSLIQCGYPPSVGTNDVSVIDGTWVHINNEDEPADRLGFQSATAEVTQEPRKLGKIAVVTEILEGGAPWEGGGGLEGVADAHAAIKAAEAAALEGRTAPRAAARPTPVAVRPPAGRPAPVAARPVAKPAPAPVAVEEVAEIGQEVVDAATNSVFNVLMKNPTGIPRAALKVQTFAEVKKSTKDEALATSVIDTYFEPGMEANLEHLLAELNHQLVGSQVKPVA